MATRTQVIEVPLPEHAEPAAEELELLRMTFQAIVGLRYEDGETWRQVLRHLQAEGWNVEYGLRWHVEARRGREHEEACGRTRDEAFGRLDHVTRADPPMEGTP